MFVSLNGCAIFLIVLSLSVVLLMSIKFVDISDEFFGDKVRAFLSLKPKF
jgi:hypothetical protein